MTAFPDNLQFKAVIGSQNATGLYTNGPFHGIVQMAANEKIHLGIFKHTFLDHGFCTTGALFSGLKKKFDVPLQRLLIFAEDRCCG